MSCAKFEPQWAYEWQIRDSDWAQMILKLAKIEQYQLTQSMLPDRLHLLIYAYINMRKSGLAGQKMFLTRFDKIFWNENVCVLSASLSEKQIQLYLITGEVCAMLISNQGHWAASRLF